MHRPGELLRALRQKRGWTQERLATRAQVTTRTIRYWEADQQHPRDVELESLLKALKVTAQERAQVMALLSDPRSIRLDRKVEAAHNVPTSLLGPPPGIGDLLRAMRMRRNWTQEHLAEEMGINRSTVIRWEATRTLPSEEDVYRLCRLLNAAPKEQAAFQTKRLTPASWAPQLSLEECREQLDSLAQARGGNGALMPLLDLHTLALKRHLRYLIGEAPEAIRLLAMLDVQHSWWLYMQGRMAEACAGNWRALNLARGRFPPEMFWINALNLLAAHATRTEPENGVRLLSPWLRLLPAAYHLYLLSDMALYAGRAQRATEAETLIRQAYHLLQRHSGSSAEEAYFNWYYRTTKARVLLSIGKPVEALDWLPALDRVGDERIGSLLVWADAYLTAGERNMAGRHLDEAQTLLVAMPLPQRQSKMEQLARQL